MERITNCKSLASTVSKQGQCERELDITIYRDNCVEFLGAQDQLVSEGLIPSGFEWPIGSTAKRWQAHGFEFQLRRRRPPGHTGPMRSWLDLDYWKLRVLEGDRDANYYNKRRIERLVEALRIEYHAQSTAGHAEWSKHWKDYWSACEDSAFQSFKSKVLPELKNTVRK